MGRGLCRVSSTFGSTGDVPTMVCIGCGRVRMLSLRVVDFGSVWVSARSSGIDDGVDGPCGIGIVFSEHDFSPVLDIGVCEP